MGNRYGKGPAQRPGEENKLPAQEHVDSVSQP